MSLPEIQISTSDICVQSVVYNNEYLEQAMFDPRRAKRALGSVENSRCPLLIDSEMAGPIKLKLGGMVEGMQENVLAKEFF